MSTAAVGDAFRRGLDMERDAGDDFGLRADESDGPTGGTPFVLPSFPPALLTVLFDDFLSPLGRASGGTAATLVCLVPPPAPRELDSPPPADADESLPVSARAPVLALAPPTDALEAGLAFSFSFTPPEVFSPLPALAALGVPHFDPPFFDEGDFAAALGTAAAGLALLFGVDGFDAEGFCGTAAKLCLLAVCIVGVVGFVGGACTAGFACSVLPLILLFATLASPAPTLPSTAVPPVVRPLCELEGFPAEEAGRDLLAPAAPREVGVEGLDGDGDDATAGGRRLRRGLSESSDEELVPLLVSPRSSRLSTTRDWSIGNLRVMGGWYIKRWY